MLVVATIVVLSVIAGGLVLWRRAQPGNSVSGSAVSAPSRLTRVTFDTGLQTDPVFSPAGTDIAYASDQSGNFDIYVRTLESNATRRLTSDPAHEFEPRWSPDGSTIAFRSERDGGGVYVVPAQGGPERRLIAGNGTFQWSPDSRELRYLRPPSQPAEHWTLVAVAATGGAATELFPDLWKQGRFASFGFHPDGRISVWGLHETRGLGFFTRSAEGTLVKSAIPRMPEALNDMVHNGSPRFAWNRAGTALLLETDDNVGIRNLWRVRVDPATLTWLAIERLTAGPGADVAAEASADDSRIVFSAQQVSDRLWRLPFDASGRRLLGGHPITNPNDGGGTFDLTPDGKASLFTLIRRGTYAVDLVRLENESGRLSFVRKDAMSARLSPDGRFAAYLHWRLETTDKDTGAVDATVMIRDMVTGREHPAIPWNRKGPHPCAWTTDGRYLLVDDNDRRVCLWPVSDTMATSSERVLVEHADDARPSPNGRWLLYAMNAGARAGLQGPTIGITTWNGPPDRPAVSVVDVGGRVAYPRWSPDGRRVYYLRQEDGPYYNVWGADVDPATARVLGSPFRLTHYTSRTQQIDPGWSWLDTAVTAKHFYVPVHTESGAIWLLDNIPR